MAIIIDKINLKKEVLDFPAWQKKWFSLKYTRLKSCTLWHFDLLLQKKTVSWLACILQLMNWYNWLMKHIVISMHLIIRMSMIVNDLFMKHIVTGRGSTEFSRSVENINCEWARLMVWSYLNLNKPGADLWNLITWCLPKAWKGRAKHFCLNKVEKSSFSFSSKIKTEW